MVECGSYGGAGRVAANAKVVKARGRILHDHRSRSVRRFGGRYMRRVQSHALESRIKLVGCGGVPNVAGGAGAGVGYDVEKAIARHVYAPVKLENVVVSWWLINGIIEWVLVVKVKAIDAGFDVVVHTLQCARWRRGRGRRERREAGRVGRRRGWWRAGRWGGRWWAGRWSGRR